MRPSRLGLVNIGMALFAVALVVRAGQVQLWQGRAWAARGIRQHVASAPAPAPRGAIVDATGNVLAESRELVRLSIAPGEVREAPALRRELARAGVGAQWIARALDRHRAWVQLPGEFAGADVATTATRRGVYADPVIERVYSPSGGVRRLVGRVGPHGEPLDGLELALDSLLRGTSGAVTSVRDARGRRFESPTTPGRPATPGHAVVLTLNGELQGICDRALADAVGKMGATGGDIVVLDPRDGAVLALASRRPDPLSTASTALTEPFEPGSTLKPFIAATLLTRGRATPDDVVDTHGGSITLNRRTIVDVHKAGRLSLADVIRWSSNVGIVEFALRLSPREEYEALRDFGFGSPTGVPYPSESPGTLREPRTWSKQSAASLAIGYEVAVTPLQLAAAYSSIANGGELLEPALVREVRAPDGTVVYRHRRRVVRRVMTPAVAQSIRRMLVDAVERGTAVHADLATFNVAGKSGTARRTRFGAGYSARMYTASFVGLFPAADPQYVILVKLDNPTGTYYGGLTAAPVTKAVLEAALAARDAALDRNALADQRGRGAHAPRDAAGTAQSATVSAEPLAVAVALGDETVLPAAQAESSQLVAVSASTRRPVPDIRGLPLRSAVAALHRAGFQVHLSRGAEMATIPSAGALVAPGETVRLIYAQ
ncbi:MAG: penicillin-binding protein [Gemmatimonadaceae bacterium]